MATVDPLAKDEVKQSQEVKQATEESIRKQLEEVRAKAKACMDLGSVAAGQLDDAVSYGEKSLAQGKAALDQLKGIIANLDPKSHLAKKLNPVLDKATDSNQEGQVAITTVKLAINQAQISLTQGIREMTELQAIIDSLPPSQTPPTLIFSDMVSSAKDSDKKPSETLEAEKTPKATSTCAV